MICPSCGTENREGRKFCSECGTALARGCPSCGAANEPGEKFCGECGAALDARSATAAAAGRRSPPPSAGSSPSSSPTSSASRRSRRAAMPEEVRELLSRYFDTCRRLIELYGGTVEKFIGDAVMAVWGTPVATEDDAERAVRAALDLVAAVSALGDEVGAPELARSRRRPHRRGRRHPRRRGTGHGRRRPRQHGGADPVGGEPGTVSSATPTRRRASHRSRTRTRARTS